MRVYECMHSLLHVRIHDERHTLTINTKHVYSGRCVQHVTHGETEFQCEIGLCDVVGQVRDVQGGRGRGHVTRVTRGGVSVDICT